MQGRHLAAFFESRSTRTFGPLACGCRRVLVCCRPVAEIVDLRCQSVQERPGFAAADDRDSAPPLRPPRSELSLQHAADRRPRPPACDHAVPRTAQPCADPRRRRRHHTHRAPAAASVPTGFKTGRVEARPRVQAGARTSPFAGTSPAERRRSRTYQPWGYHGLPVLKTGRVWLNETVWAGSAPPCAPSPRFSRRARSGSAAGSRRQVMCPPRALSAEAFQAPAGDISNL